MKGSGISPHHQLQSAGSKARLETSGFYQTLSLFFHRRVFPVAIRIPLEALGVIIITAS